MIFKTDANQRGILAILREFPGISIIDLSAVGKGCPDILVGYKGINHLFEIKNKDSRGRLNELQKKWHENFQGTAHVVYSLEDVLNVLEII